MDFMIIGIQSDCTVPLNSVKRLVFVMVIECFL